MQSLHSPAKLLAAAAVAGVLATGGVASAADAPVVSKQRWVAGYALVDFPGTGFQKGEWLGSKAKMVYREVTLERGETVRLTLRALEGQKIRALGGHEGRRLRVTALDRDYVGKRSVRVRVSVAPKVDGEVTERVYALSR